MTDTTEPTDFKVAWEDARRLLVIERKMRRLGAKMYQQAATCIPDLVAGIVRQREHDLPEVYITRQITHSLEKYIDRILIEIEAILKEG